MAITIAATLHDKEKLQRLSDEFTYSRVSSIRSLIKDDTTLSGDKKLRLDSAHSSLTSKPVLHNSINSRYQYRRVKPEPKFESRPPLKGSTFASIKPTPERIDGVNDVNQLDKHVSVKPKHISSDYNAHKQVKDQFRGIPTGKSINQAFTNDESLVGTTHRETHRDQISHNDTFRERKPVPVADVHKHTAEGNSHQANESIVRTNRLADQYIDQPKYTQPITTSNSERNGKVIPEVEAAEVVKQPKTPGARARPSRLKPTYHRGLSRTARFLCAILIFSLLAPVCVMLVRALCDWHIRQFMSTRLYAPCGDMKPWMKTYNSAIIHELVEPGSICAH